MQIEHKTLLLASLAAVFTWTLDSWLDHLFFYDQPFTELLFSNVPLHEIYIRLLTTGYILLFGVLASVILGRQKRMGLALEEARTELEKKVEHRTRHLHKACEQLRSQTEALKRKGRAFEESQQRLRQMFEKTNAIKLIIDAETGDVMDANPSACRFYGYERDHLLKMTLFDLSCDPRDSIEERISLVIQGRINHFFCKQRQATGQIREVEVNACPLDDHGRKMLYCVKSDVTERLHTEEALRASERRYRMLLNNANDAVFVHGLDEEHRPSKFSEVNDVACEMLGYSREELLELSPRDLISEMHVSELPSIMKKLMEERHIVFQTDGVKKNGEVIPLEISTHLFSLNDTPTLLSMARDITERQQAEAVQQECSMQLRRLSSQLMSAQENERAIIARELHDSIGQTLTAVKFSLENTILQLEQRDGGRASESLKSLIPSMQDAIEEVRHICTHLRPSLLDDFGILATMKWFCKQYRSTYPHLRVQTEWSVDEADIPEKLKIVIFRVTQEAMNNVAKHSEARVVSLKLKKAEGFIELQIRDDGVGFAPAGPSGRTHKSYLGMGIGSMRERTQLSGGSFTIETQLHAGTCITARWAAPLPG